MKDLVPPREDHSADDLIPVGKIVGTHGLKGLLKIELLTEFPERLAPGEKLLLGDSWREVLDAAFHKERLQIKLEGVSDRTAAEQLRNQVLYAVNTELDLEEDEFMVEELIGAKVIEADGTELGTIEDVMPMPAQDLLVVGDTLIPFVKEFVKEVDTDNRIVRVALIPGMKASDPLVDQPEPRRQT